MAGSFSSLSTHGNMEANDLSHVFFVAISVSLSEAGLPQTGRTPKAQSPK